MPETTTVTSTPPTTSPGKALSPIAQVRNGLEQMRPQFAVVLPSHITPERFERVVMTAINNNPDLLNADRRSLFNAATRAATDGLLPDGREGAFVIFNERSGRRVVAWIPMVFGLIKKIRQSGEVDSIGARIVYEREIEANRFKFVIEDGTERLYHDPLLFGDRGAKVLVYTYARFKETGTVEYAPLHRDDVLKRRAVSKSAAIWRDWEDEMWLKTAIRAISKRLPLSAEISATIDRDEDPTEFDKLKAEVVRQLSAVPPEPPPAEPDDAVPFPDDGGPLHDDRPDDEPEPTPETGQANDGPRAELFPS